MMTHSNDNCDLTGQSTGPNGLIRFNPIELSGLHSRRLFEEYGSAFLEFYFAHINEGS